MDNVTKLARFQKVKNLIGYTKLQLRSSLNRYMTGVFDQENIGLQR